MYSKLKNKVLYCVFLCMCACESTETQPVTIHDTSLRTDGDVQALKNFFYMIPSPMETSILIKKTGVDYHYDFLNAPDNYKHYQTTNQKAINLGVYCADLCYATLFDQQQDLRFYISSAKKLAEDLGVMDAFDSQMIDRVEYNLEERDSMLKIVSEIYWIADAHLKESENATVSSLMMYGGFIETLYLASNLYSLDKSNQALAQVIADQVYALYNLNALLKKTSEIDPKTQQTVEHTHELLEIYRSFKTQSENPEAVVLDSSNQLLIKGENQIQMTQSDFMALFEKIVAIRDNIVS